MFDIRSELEKYPSIDLKKIEENNVDLPEDIKNSMVLFNKALGNIRGNSEDIAVIELKKAIAINPGFYEAMNLLGVCYACMGNESKAEELFEAVMKAEHNSIKAMDYLERLRMGDSPESGKPGKKIKTGRGNKSDKSFDSKGKKASPMDGKLKTVLAFLMGAVIIFLVSIPFYGSGSSEPVGEAKNDHFREQYEKLDGEYQKLLKQLEQKNNQLKTNQLALDNFMHASRLFDVDKLVREKKSVEAADALMEIESSKLKNEQLSKYFSLYEQVVPKVAQSLYNDGNNDLWSRKYQEALQKFQKAISYGNKWVFMDAMLYQMGVCHQRLKETDLAKDRYEEVIRTYPASRYVRMAQNRLKELS